MEKAIEYTKLRKPYIINNLEMQYDIQDRRSVYKILEKEGIELPRHAIFDRSDPEGIIQIYIILLYIGYKYIAHLLGLFYVIIP